MTEPGDGLERLKSKAGAVTVRERTVEWVAPPPDPVIVIVVVTGVAVLVAENLTVMVHVGMHGLFVNVAVTPVGSVDVVNVSEAAVPVESVAVMDDVGLVDPWSTDSVPRDGDERVKSKGTATVTSKVQVLMS